MTLKIHDRNMERLNMFSLLPFRGTINFDREEKCFKPISIAINQCVTLHFLVTLRECRGIDFLSVLC